MTHNSRLCIMIVEMDAYTIYFTIFTGFKKNLFLVGPLNNSFIVDRNFKVDFILLAGYLKLIPNELVQAYPRSMLNIHPSLLPAFGGKGFYGLKVHQAVIASGAR